MSTLPFMPEAETAHLMAVYGQARVILEYGPGGSTHLAAAMANKFIMSVESDLGWVQKLRADVASAVSPVILHHIDIGPTGRWSRPLTDAMWRGYHRYPNSVWGQSWFRQPDVVLIDGRFRTACLAAILLQTKHEVRVLFDDYGVREKHQLIEKVIKPSRLVGRMAQFIVPPDAFSKTDIGFLIEQFFQISVHGETEAAYRLPASAR